MNTQDQDKKKLEISEKLMSTKKLWATDCYKVIMDKIAPNGFKKVMGNRLTVPNQQFVTKGQIESATHMAITVYNAREDRIMSDINELIRLNTEDIQSLSREVSSEKGKSWIFRSKKKLNEAMVTAARLEAENKAYRNVLELLETLVPKDVYIKQDADSINAESE